MSDTSGILTSWVVPSSQNPGPAIGRGGGDRLTESSEAGSGKQREPRSGGVGVELYRGLRATSLD